LKWILQKRTFLSWVVGTVLVIVLAAQAISDLVARNFLGGTNFYGQPIDPILQILTILIILIVGGVGLWMRLKNRRD
jgi:hypothetical protein